MKNSPDPDWFNKLERRLDNYAEEPGAEVWDRIASKIGKQKDPVWLPWANRSALLILFVILSWSGKEMITGDFKSTESVERQDEVLTYEDRSSEKSAHSHTGVQSDPKRSDDDPRVNRDRKPGANSARQSGREPRRVAENMKIAGANERPGIDLFTNQSREIPVEKNIALSVDSLRPATAKEVTAKDSIHRAETNSIIPRKRKERVFLYASVSPSLSFQKISPLMNDGIGIKRFNSRPVLSSDRLGVSLQAGIQSKISKRLELYGGLTFYHQSQVLVYEYLSGEIDDASQRENFDYILSPGTTAKSVNYAMINLGAEAGLMYYLSGGRLTQKIGAGLAWQHGMRRKSEGGTYDNASSQYLFYQVFYRNEYAVNTSLRIFVQPFYQHSLTSKESIREPFTLKPYRAGLIFGIVFDCR